jgi:hypothetical protein
MQKQLNFLTFKNATVGHSEGLAFITGMGRGVFTARYVLPTQCVCVLCGSENKQRLFHCTALMVVFYN